jgi:GNAT superfamily N-acetyltransferase
LSIHEPSVRIADIDDAPELARLLSLLGYPVARDAISERWGPWGAEGNLALVVQGERSLMGAITLHRMTVLHRPRPVGRITSLVVDSPSRGRGLGRALLLSAEQAMAHAGCGLLEVTSHARFATAHDFYRHLGYEQTSLRFVKALV